MPNPTVPVWRTWSRAQQLAYLNSFQAPLATNQLSPRAVFDMFESSIGGNPPFNEIMLMFEPGGAGHELGFTFTKWLQKQNAYNAYSRLFNPVYLAYKNLYEPALKRAKLIPGDNAKHEAEAHRDADILFKNAWVASASQGLQSYALTLRPKRKGKSKASEADN
jgi:hypothetical protein